VQPNAGRTPGLSRHTSAPATYAGT